jgi:nitroreductase
VSFAVEDCSAAVENILLAITTLGYATVWIDGWLRGEGRAETVGALLGVPQDKVIRILLPIGVPAEKRSPAEKKPFAERAWFNRYGT